MSSPLLILSESFGRLHDAKAVYDVKLYPNEILCQPHHVRTKQYAISLSSVIGCRCMKASSGADGRSFLTIYAYPKNSSGVRRRQTYTFFYGKTSEYEKNFAVMRKWKLAVSYLVSSGSPDLSVLTSFLNGELEALPFPERRWLVLINPFSGRKASESVFGSLVSSMFAEAELDYTVVKSEYGGHATDFIRQAQLDNFTGIVTVSGDGLLSEVINGLLSRPDWQEVIRKPLGVVPCGSGNALAAMMCTLTGERFDRGHALHCAFQLLRPSINELPYQRPFDLMAVDTIDGRIYSFLATAWGLVADVDIESEKFRFMGKARFMLGALARIVNLRTYRGRVSFLPVDPAEAKQAMQARRRKYSSPSKRCSISGIPQTIISDDGQRHTLTGNDAIDFPSVGRYRSLDDLATARTTAMHGSTSSLVNSTPIASKNPLMGSADSRHSLNLATNTSLFGPIDNTENTNTYSQDNAQNNSTNSGSGGSGGGFERSLSPQRFSYIDTPLLPAKVTDPVPLNWITIEDAFIFVVAAHCTHLSTETVAHLGIKPSDGAMWLLITRAPTTRRTLIRQYFAMGKADVDFTSDTSFNVESYRVLAFRIEPVPPSPPSRILTVDGERVAYGPIQCQILPGIASLI